MNHPDAQLEGSTSNSGMNLTLSLPGLDRRKDVR